MIRLTEIIINNIAPFDEFRISLDESNAVVLSGLNGAGKTTILSFIVDSFFELAKKAFYSEFKNKSDEYYRIDSKLFCLDIDKPSLLYLRYKENETYYDYVNINGLLTEKDYKVFVNLDNPIPYNNFGNTIANERSVKYWSLKDNKKIITLFNSQLLCYFPSYRYENPLFLNAPYKIQLKMSTDMSFNGCLTNPIEINDNIKTIANWILDLVIDQEVYKNSNSIVEQQLYNKLCSVVSDVLYTKTGVTTRLGIGKRNSGASRISVMNKLNNTQLYPSIFNMSSGESSLITLFAEILRQSDNIGQNERQQGIVLIDEIEKYLHITLQKDALPRLINAFPNIQFIVTSHSPFFTMGLAEIKVNHKVFDLNNHGIECTYRNNKIYEEVYNIMTAENDKIKSQYDNLVEQIKLSSKTIVITEGKTDWKHVKLASRELGIDISNIELYEYEEALGDTNLECALDYYSKLSNSRKIIGMFDRDNFSKLKKIGAKLKDNEYISLGNQVYAFSIPLVNENLYGESISIEHYYDDTNLKKDYNGRRLFLANEFNDKGLGIIENYLCRASGINDKCKSSSIIEEKVYDISEDRDCKNSLALSKNAFVDALSNDNDFRNGVSFENFRRIFDIIEKIDQIDKVTKEDGEHYGK